MGHRRVRKIRAKLIYYCQKYGLAQKAERLQLPGAAGHPGTCELHDLADLERVRFEHVNLENVNELITVYGRCENAPIKFRIGFTLTAEKAQHYVLLQVWGQPKRLAPAQTARGCIDINLPASLLHRKREDNNDKEGANIADLGVFSSEHVENLIEERLPVISDDSAPAFDHHVKKEPLPATSSHGAPVLIDLVEEAEPTAVHSPKAPASSQKKSCFVDLCAPVDLPVPDEEDLSENIDDRARDKGQQMLLLAKFNDQTIPAAYPHFTNNKTVEYEGAPVKSYRWECVSCVPKCRFRGRVSLTSPTSIRVQMHSDFLDDSHLQPEHGVRAVRGATPEQWKMLLEHAHGTHTEVG